MRINFTFFSTITEGYKARRLRHFNKKISNVNFVLLGSKKTTDNVEASYSFFSSYLFAVLKKFNTTFSRIISEQIFYLCSLFSSKIWISSIIVVQPRCFLFNILLRLFGKKVICEVCEPPPSEWKSTSFIGSDYFNSSLARYFYSKSLNYCDAIYCFNQSSANLLNDYYNTPIYNVGPLPEYRDFYLCDKIIKKSSLENKLLYIGPLKERKGILTLLNELSSDIFFKDKVIFVGANDTELSEVLSYPCVCEAYGYTKKLDDLLKDLSDNYQLAAVVPSTFEGFPRVIWDHVSLGIPIFSAIDFSDLGLSHSMTKDNLYKFISCSESFSLPHKDLVPKLSSDFDNKFEQMLQDISDEVSS